MHLWFFRFTFLVSAWIIAYILCFNLLLIFLRGMLRYSCFWPVEALLFRFAPKSFYSIQWLPTVTTDKMLQAHLVHFLPLTYTWPFLQRTNKTSIFNHSYSLVSVFSLGTHLGNEREEKNRRIKRADGSKQLSEKLLKGVKCGANLIPIMWWAKRQGNKMQKFFLDTSQEFTPRTENVASERNLELEEEFDERGRIYMLYWSRHYTWPGP